MNFYFSKGTPIKRSAERVFYYLIERVDTNFLGTEDGLMKVFWNETPSSLKSNGVLFGF